MNNAVIKRYDFLISDNNDSVHDPKVLQNYMNKRDGQGFVDKMELNKDKSVLEIGVGTGRLALRVAPLCKRFCGVDISPKTINRAKENLIKLDNVTLLCGDFFALNFEQVYDVVYSSLTFMHFEDKQKAIAKAADLLNDGGKFVLSTDKNQDEFIDTKSGKMKIFPDTPAKIKSCISASGLILTDLYETEFANIFIAEKQSKRSRL